MNSAGFPFILYYGYEDNDVKHVLASGIDPKPGARRGPKLRSATGGFTAVETKAVGEAMVPDVQQPIMQTTG